MPETSPTTPARALPVLRAMIDSVDHEVLQLLSRRNGLVAEVAAWKRENATAIRDHERERQLLDDRMGRAAPLGLRPEVIESIYRLVLWASRDRQASLKAEVPPDVEPQTVAIIGGHGGMGRHMATIFGDLGHAVMIADVETDLTPAAAAAVADVVMISVPIRLTESVIAEVGPSVREDALLCDVTSIKSGPVEAMLTHSRASVIGTHPLYGPSVHTVQGQRIVLTPARINAGRDWNAWLRQMFHARGLTVVETTPESHDRIMAVVQVLTHFSTEVMGQTLASLGVPLEETLPFMSPVYEMDLLMTARHFAQSPELYAAIQAANPRTSEVTAAFAAAATALSTSGSDQASFESLFDAVRTYFGDFSEKALDQSSYLIDRMVERS